MTKLKLGALTDERPVRIALELPAATHRELVAYAEVLARETGHSVEPAKLVAPMIAKFIASDREFTEARRSLSSAQPKSE